MRTKNRQAGAVSKLARRAMISAVAAATLSTDATLAADKYWNNNASGTWAVAGNWSPSGAPLSGDNVYLGDALLISDAQVFSYLPTIVANLAMTNGMMLDLKASLQVNGTMDVNAFNANGCRVYLRNSIAVNDLAVGNLNINGNSDLFLVDDPTVLISGAMTVAADADLIAGGTFNFSSNAAGPALVFNGGWMGNGPTSLTFNQLGTARIDLDGSSIADDKLAITSRDVANNLYQSLTINGTGLNDAYDDTVTLRPGNSLNMNLSEGWTLGGTGKIRFQDDNAFEVPAAVTGAGTLVVNGALEFEDFNFSINAMQAKIDSPTVFNFSADVYVGGWDTLDLNGASTVNGGSFVLGGTGHNQLNFNGPTAISGGTFTTHTSTADSEVRFNGATNWAGGTITLNGRARQIGNATVSSSTVINAGTFDVDGTATPVTWDINAPLTLNATALEADANGVVNARFDISSSLFFPASLTVNLAGGGQWTSAGTINVSGSGVGAATVLAGSDVAITGRVNASGAVAFGARVDFLSQGTTTINTDGALFLNGGSTADPNTMNGHRFLGAGTLRASAGHALVGSGTIATGVDFDDDASIRARDGTLTISGAVADVGIIGTANANSALNLPQTFNTAVATRMELNGGTVSGLTLVNGGEIRGKGLIASSQLNNTGSITTAGNGTLAINTGFLPDLDGSTESGVLHVSSGNLHVQKQLADAFDGTINLTEGRSLVFDTPWTLGAAGAIEVVAGAVGTTADVIAPSQTLSGATHLPSSTILRFTGPTTFAPTSVTTLDSSFAVIDLLADGTITNGATFVTNGISDGVIRPAGRLELNHAAVVEAHVINQGTLHIAGAGAGSVSIEAYTQNPTADAQLSILGPTPGTQHDRLSLTKTATLRGSVSLSTGAYDPAYLLPHEIIRATGGILQAFEQVNGFVLSPTKYLAVTYDYDSVFVTAAIPGDANLDGHVNIADFAILASNFNGTGVWTDGSFNGDLAVGIGDFSLLATHFNSSIPASLMRPPEQYTRPAAVPEAASGLLGLCGLIARRRRK